MRRVLPLVVGGGGLWRVCFANWWQQPLCRFVGLDTSNLDHVERLAESMVLGLAADFLGAKALSIPPCLH